jgi:hypothetical protein
MELPESLAGIRGGAEFNFPQLEVV